MRGCIIRCFPAAGVPGGGPGGLMTGGDYDRMPGGFGRGGLGLPGGMGGGMRGPLGGDRDLMPGGGFPDPDGEFPGGGLPGGFGR